MPNYSSYYGGGGPSIDPYGNDKIFDAQRMYEGPGNMDLRNRYRSALGNQRTMQYAMQYKLPRRKKNEQSSFMPYGQSGYGASPPQQSMGVTSGLPYGYYPDMYAQYGRLGGQVPYQMPQSRGASPLF